MYNYIPNLDLNQIQILFTCLCYQIIVLEPDGVGVQLIIINSQAFNLQEIVASKAKLSFAVSLVSVDQNIKVIAS